MTSAYHLLKITEIDKLAPREKIGLLLRGRCFSLEAGRIRYSLATAACRSASSA